MDGIALTLNGVTKRFRETVAVDDMSLQIMRGEFVSLLGPSGCGKTTTLRMIAGFIRPDAGLISIEGKDVTLIPPFHRDIGMVFQHYALFPHMTIEDNVAFGLRRRRVAKPEIRDRVRAALALVRLDGLEKRKPRELSGGQQQRCALARAIVIRPQILLFDEPLSNLDAKLRKSMQIELRHLQEALGITTVHVTHDQAEALSLSDRVVIMNQGRIEQQGPPMEVYTRPASVFVADFVGESNLMRGHVVEPQAGQMTVELETGERLRMADAGITGLVEGDQICAVARPEAVQIHRPDEDLTDANILPAEIHRIVYTGPITMTLLRLPSGLELMSEDHNEGAEIFPFRSGEKVKVSILPQSLFLIRG